VGKVLPSEEQWEKAARGEKGAPFPWGDAAPDCARAVHAGCARSTAPVESGVSKDNANGLYHMAGNVWEWTRTPDTSVRQIVRGGSFRSNGKGLRADRRISTGRTTSPDGAGFRCAKDSP
jgi:formylglycine-generating enzyme required for sulfatase activity